jgi:nucleoside diphosphate kinase
VAEEFYFEHRGSELYDALVENLTKDTVVVVCLAGADAVTAWRELIGAVQLWRAGRRAGRLAGRLTAHLPRLPA